jgi:multimeric flavodoxin WrbA
MTTILGISASRRSGRWSGGATELVDQIREIASDDDLRAFLKRESLAQLANFKEAGREADGSFSERYAEFKRRFGRRGLSNVDVGIVAALWSALESGADIDFVSLAEYFPPSAAPRRLDELRDRLDRARGILLGSPVYFGDRSSLASDLIQMIHADDRLRGSSRARVAAGIAVGAKRNGGQETTLVYQMLDMVRAGWLAVGNDATTTAQYGGTLCAGDLGTAWSDAYGLATSMGTGRRLARVADLLTTGEQVRLQGRLRVAFWILQDRDDYARRVLERLIAPFRDRIEPSVFTIHEEPVLGCIACDLCPTELGPDSEYRCVVRSGRDFLRREHPRLVDADAIVPVAFEPLVATGVQTRYQRFLERTRYLRRGDYVFSDLLTAPLVFAEVGADTGLPLRMLTSLIRHHTVLSRPMIGHCHEGKILNGDGLRDNWRSFIERAELVTAGRIAVRARSADARRYQPVGYAISAEREREDRALGRREEGGRDRARRAVDEATHRLRPTSDPSRR